DAKNPHAVPKDQVPAMRASVEADFRGFVREFAPRLFKQAAASPLLAWAVGQMQKTPAHVAAACLDAILAADLRPTLKKITAPTAVLHGRHDALFPIAGGDALAKAIKGATLAVFEESGQTHLLTEPERFNEARAVLTGRE